MGSTMYWPRVMFVSVTSRKVFHRAEETERYSGEYEAACDSSLSYVPPMGALMPVSWALDLGARPCRRCRWDRWTRRLFERT